MEEINYKMKMKEVMLLNNLVLFLISLSVINYCIAQDIDKNSIEEIKLVNALLDCDVDTVKEIIDSDLDVTFTIKGNSFPANETPYSLIKYLQCQWPYSTDKSLKNFQEEIKKIFLIGRPDIKFNDPMDETLILPNGQKNYSEALFESIKRCNVNEINNIINSGVDPNLRYQGSEIYYRGLTPIAFAMKMECGEFTDSLTFIEENGKLVNQVVETLIKKGSDPNKLVRIYETGEYVPSFHMGYYAGVVGYGTNLAINAIKFGADPNAKRSDGYNILKSIFGQYPQFEEIQELIKNGVKFKIESFSGRNQTSLLPFYSLSKDEETAIFEIIKSEKVEYHKGHVDTPKSNVFYNCIETIYNNQYSCKDKNYPLFPSIENIQRVVDNLNKYFPSSINHKTGNKKANPIMHLMGLLCPIKTNYENEDFDFERVKWRNERIPSQKLFKTNVYKWFLSFLKEALIDVNDTDSQNISLLTYAIHSCPYEVVKILIDKGANINHESLNPETIFDNYKKIKASIDPTGQQVTRFPFNEDHRNLKLLLEKRNDYDKSLPFDEQFFSEKIPPFDIDLYFSDIKLRHLINSNMSKIDNPSEKIIKFKEIGELGISKNGKVNVSGDFLYKYSTYKNIEVKNIDNLPESGFVDVENLFPDSSVPIEVIVTTVANDIIGSRILENKVKSLGFTKKQNGKFVITIIGKNLSNNIFLSPESTRTVEFDSNVRKVEFIVTNGNEKIEKEKILSLKYELDHLNPIIIDKKVVSDSVYFNSLRDNFLSMAPNFNCKSPFCDVLKRELGPNGELKISLDSEKLTQENSIRANIWKLANSPEEERQLIVDDILKNKNIQMASYLPSFLIQNPVNDKEEYFNMTILNGLNIYAFENALFDRGEILMLMDLKYTYSFKGAQNLNFNKVLNNKLSVDEFVKNDLKDISMLKEYIKVKRKYSAKKSLFKILKGKFAAIYSILEKEGILDKLTFNMSQSEKLILVQDLK